MGFAGLGDTIRQGSADTSGESERDRLSWHTGILPGTINQNPSFEPDYIFGGWRSGDNTELNYDSNWDRVVLRYTVPEPATIFLLVFGGLGLLRRRHA